MQTKTPLASTSRENEMGRWIRIVAALAAVGLAGCAGFGRTLETPRISLATLQVQEAKGLETVFLVQLRVTNPNEVDLDVRGLECRLDINDREFAFGVSNARVRIPAMGSEIIPVTVYSSVLDIMRGLLGLPQREDLRYRLQGKVRLEGNGWVPSTLPFDSRGSVSLKDLAAGRRAPS
jgi:LEA14-like dessication related protein